MKIGILHHDLEWSETQFHEKLNEMGFDARLYDVRETTSEELAENDFILNRVYASVANRDCKSNAKVLKLLKEIEKKGIPCINSYLTSYADYSKKVSSEIMHRNGIYNPKTIKVNNLNEINSALGFAKKVGFPVILKRDMGGRGKDVEFVNSRKELKRKLKERFSNNDQYNQGHVVQEFLKNVRGYDCRIAIINGKFSFASSRTLISGGEKHCWLASVSKGSKKNPYTPSQEEIDLAIKATQSIGAVYNEVDMTFTKNGPAIIENNPTPSYSKKVELNQELLPIAVELIKDKILEAKNISEDFNDILSVESREIKSILKQHEDPYKENKLYVSIDPDFAMGYKKNKRGKVLHIITNKLNPLLFLKK